ncbi:uncharacterized protein [Centruroides vittatus]|uniref:uncharacterized protein isoform X2 n=1 Tax=Centruroides vittatus TaxID=120091 RepID=UPI00350FE2AF
MMFNIKVLGVFIFILSIASSLPDNFYRRLEDSESDNQSVAEIVREEYIDQNGNKRTRGCNHAKPPLSGSLTCNYYREREFCEAKCIANYKFPDGSIVKSYNCSYNGNMWNKIEIIPDCEPAVPSIGCDIVTGKHQFVMCITDSKTQRCKSQCQSGYGYPDGSRRMETTCTKSNGEYDPVKEIPDCVFTGEEDDDPDVIIFDFEGR